MSDLLIEIGTEELPTKAVLDLSYAFAANMEALFAKTHIDYETVRIFATPRRLALLVKQIADEIPGKTVEHRGPPVNAATPAVQGFADKFNVSVNDLEKLKNDKGEYYIYKQALDSRATSSVILELTEQALSDLPIKKPMSWGEHTFKFVRPVHWVVVLFGDKVLDGKILGQQIGRETFGHRFLKNEALTIKHPEDYENILENKGSVIPSFEKRKNEIQKQILAESEKLKLKANIDEDLLDEVASIVEWPVALLGKFSENFLSLPPEVITLTLKQNQKTFTLTDANGKMQPYFICIANISSQDPAQVISGNEKVVRARLSDAAFFFAQDKKQTLEDRSKTLDNIVYQKGLGSLLDKSERIADIAKKMAGELNLDKTAIGQAAELCKGDLTSAMVGEFPELQGIMGAYYAQHDKQKSEVVEAIREQYKPQGAHDELPLSNSGAVLSMSDKFVTLNGVFSIGQKPTGDKDPFGLRRAAIGILRIIIDKKLFLDLKDYVNDEVSDFILDRLESLLKDQGYQTELFAAVRAVGCTKPYDIYLRVQALDDFSKKNEARSVIGAHKRVNNLLKQSKIEQEGIDENHLPLPAEKQLVASIKNIEKNVKKLCEEHKYSIALTQLASIKLELDLFFEGVMVMDNDLSLRNNRLAILKKLNDLFTQIADLSYLVVS